MRARELVPGAVRARHCGVVLVVVGTAIAAPALVVSVIVLAIEGVHPTMPMSKLAAPLVILVGSGLTLAGCRRIARARHESVGQAATGAAIAAMGGALAGMPGPVLVWSKWSAEMAAGVSFHGVVRERWPQLGLLFPLLVAATGLYSWAAYRDAARQAG